jgi:hypothetical protein
VGTRRREPALTALGLVRVVQGLRPSRWDVRLWFTRPVTADPGRMARTVTLPRDPDINEEPALTRAEWYRLHAQDPDLVEIVRFHQPHPALLIA